MACWRGYGIGGRVPFISMLCNSSASNRSDFRFSIFRQSFPPLNASGWGWTSICPTQVTPGFLDTRAAMGVGLTLDLLFILSLAVVIRPTTRGEILVLALAALSPTTVYALERANSDLIVYLLVVSAWMLDLAPRP